MKRYATIVLLLAYAFSYTELHQAMRLPLLLEHYEEHSAKVELSFWEFLVMHYKTDVAHDETDTSLPFKDCSHSVSSPTIALISSFTLQPNPEPADLDHHSLYLTRIPQLRAADIFQPPRI